MSAPDQNPIPVLERTGACLRRFVAPSPPAHADRVSRAAGGIVRRTTTPGIRPFRLGAIRNRLICRKHESLRSESGQTTTEWVMIAGILTAVAIAIFDYRHPWSMTGALIYVGKAMFVSLRTMAP